MSNKDAGPEKRTQEVAEETARLLADAVVLFTDKALESRLKPITEGAKDAANQAKKAAEKAESASKDIKEWIDFLNSAGGHLEQMERNHRALVEDTARGSLDAFRTELQPLLGTVNGVAAKTDETTHALKDATGNFSEALDALRAGPPSLAAFLVEAKADLDQIRKPSVEVHAKLDVLAQQVEQLEQMVKIVSNRVVAGLIITGISCAGVMVWLAFRFLAV